MASTEKVWCKFSVTKKDATVLNLRIQDLPKNRLEDAVDVNIKYFTPEETFHRAAGIPDNPEAVQECRGFVTEMFKDPAVHIVVCCPDDSEAVGEIIGVSIMALSTKDDDDDMEDLEFKTDEVKKYFELLGGYFSLYDLMKEQNLDKCFDGRGVVVHPDYRSLGIARELFKIRRSMCKHYEVPATAAWMTTYGSQKAAENDGWETVFEVSYDELARKHGVIFTDVPQTLKLMFTRNV